MTTEVDTKSAILFERLMELCDEAELEPSSYWASVRPQLQEGLEVLSAESDRREEILEGFQERIKIARKAVLLIREKRRSVASYSKPFPLTEGFYGLLDYIETGIITKILEPNLRKVVRTVQGREDVTMV